ncbi:hypothetical protein GCM10010377_80470 [Streptomyces viridiviolaceus]|nr:hypothetical protein GCM10010377_80470 [Streptomyces viridiviolaceus]
MSKPRLALGLLDRLAAQGLAVPVIVADAGYGRSVSFRLALEERGWSYVMAVDPKEIARPATAEPYQPEYGGLGPTTLPRYRDTAQPLPTFVQPGTPFEDVAAAPRRAAGGVPAPRRAGRPVRQGDAAADAVRPRGRRPGPAAARHRRYGDRPDHRLPGGSLAGTAADRACARRVLAARRPPGGRTDLDALSFYPHLLAWELTRLWSASA